MTSDASATAAARFERSPRSANQTASPAGSQRKPRTGSRVKAPTSRGLPRDPQADARPRPAHGLRGGGLPEHRRVLDAEARDGDDPGRHLHPRLRLLQRQDRAPDRLDPHEPAHLAEAVAQLGLAHVVITSVDRDDLPDGGAVQFVRCIHAIRATAPATTIEILTPDFLRKPGAVEAIVDARPDVYNHNLETVPRLYPHRPPRARATSTRCACCSRSRSWTRPCSPSPASWSGWARRSARSCR